MVKSQSHLSHGTKSHRRRRWTDRERKTLTISNGQTLLQQCLHTDRQEVWMKWRHTRFRKPHQELYVEAHKSNPPSTTRKLPESARVHGPKDHIFQCPTIPGPTLRNPSELWFSPSQKHITIILNLWSIWTTLAATTHTRYSTPPIGVWKRLTWAKFQSESVRLNYM